MTGPRSSIGHNGGPVLDDQNSGPPTPRYCKLVVVSDHGGDAGRSALSRAGPKYLPKWHAVR